MHVVTLEFLQLLLLIIIANGSPIVIRQLLDGAFDLAVDFGQKLPDNRRVFGASKTWRGIVTACVVTSLAAWSFGYPPETGLLIALYAMLGDMTSSFTKRRLSMQPSSRAPFLDQVPESLLPAFMLMETFNLDFIAVLLLVLTFIILEIGLSHILYKWGVRKRPY